MSKVKNFLNDFFNNNGVLKIISFLVAFAFWFIVVGLESPEISKEFRNISVSSEFNGHVAQNNNLILASPVNLNVNVTLRGNRAEIASVKKDSITAKIDFSSVTGAGEYTLPIRIEYDNQLLTLEKVSVTEIDVKIDNKISKSVDITVSPVGTIADDYILDSVKTSPSSILITGPESIVNSIAQVKTQVDVSGLNSSVKKNLPFVLYDAEGKEISNAFLSFDTNQVLVDVNIFKTKEVDLAFNLYNSHGGNDASFINKVISPEKVVISGEESVVSLISSITLGRIDASEIPEDGYTASFAIPLPNGVKLENEEASSATVSLSYANDVTTKDFTFSVSSENIAAPAGKTATTSQKSVTVTLRGKTSDINNLSPDRITVIIDASSVMANGTSKVPVRLQIPEDINVGVLGNPTVKVSVK